MSKSSILTPEDVEHRIERGDVLVIYHGDVLKLNDWLPRHPGGDKAVLHMVGRDASDEMDVYHSKETLKRVRAYKVGCVQLPWKNLVPPIQRGEFERGQMGAESLKMRDRNLSREKEKDVEKYPPVDAETQLQIRNEFHELHDRMESEGLFQCNYWSYAREAGRVSVLFTLSILCFLFRGQSLLMLALSATFLGFGWHQCVFTVHDAGHLAITHNYWVDNLAGAFIASYVGGLSMMWWKRNHNVHHLVTNDPVHDPDIQHLPFFAVTSKLFGSVWSTFYEKVILMDAVARVMVPIQHHMYYPILCFGRFNLYRLSWMHVLYGLGPRMGQAKYLRHFELLGLCFFTWWFFYLLCGKVLRTWTERLVFVLVSHIATMPVHVQITLSHFAQSTSDLGPGESFAQRQVRTTMDVACPEWLDYIHGGLQFQVIHHLFPRMPRHNLRAAQKFVIEFCKKLGLHYEIYGFSSGNKHVIDRLYDVAQQLAVLRECNDFCQKEIISEIVGSD